MIYRLLVCFKFIVLFSAGVQAADKTAQSDSFFQHASTWVAISFIFFIVALFKPVKKMLLTKLDGRSETVRDELEEAQRLREDAQHTLAEYQRKQRDALKEAENIITEAQNEALRIKEAADLRTEELLKRREQQALDMIASAEAQALADVRSLASDIAIQATQQILKEAADTNDGISIIDKAIQDLPSKLN